VVERGDKRYMRAGRFQEEEQARAIDHGLREMLDREKIPYTVLPPQIDAINAFTASLIQQ